MLLSDYIAAYVIGFLLMCLLGMGLYADDRGPYIKIDYVKMLGTALLWPLFFIKWVGMALWWLIKFISYVIVTGFEELFNAS